MADESVKRFDRGNPAKFIKTSQGYLRADANLTRTGIFLYQMDDGTIRRELRHPDEVFHQDSLDTLHSSPVTNNHPPPDDFLNEKNTAKYMKGYSGEAKTSGKFVQSRITVTDSDTISQVLGGKSEISCGYVCKMKIEPGVFEGERYDAQQTNIRYNHIAIVKRGRGGPEVAMKLDSGDAVEVEPTTGGKMVKIKIDDADVEVSEDVAAAFKKMENKLSKAKTKLDSFEEKSDKERQDKIEGLQAKVDSLTSDLEKSEKSLAEAKKVDVSSMVKERMHVEKVASQKLSKEESAKLDSMEISAIKKLVVTKEYPSRKLDGKTDAYFDAAFEHIEEAMHKSDEAGKKIGETISGKAAGETKLDSAVAREKMLATSKEMWKGEPKN